MCSLPGYPSGQSTLLSRLSFSAMPAAALPEGERWAAFGLSSQASDPSPKQISMSACRSCHSLTTYITGNLCTDIWQSAAMCSGQFQQVGLHLIVTVCIEDPNPRRAITGLPGWVSTLAPSTARCGPAIRLMLIVGDVGQIGQQAALARLAPALLRVLLALRRLGSLCSCLSLFVLRTSRPLCALLCVTVP